MAVNEREGEVYLMGKENEMLLEKVSKMQGFKERKKDEDEDKDTRKKRWEEQWNAWNENAVTMQYQERSSTTS